MLHDHGVTMRVLQRNLLAGFTGFCFLVPGAQAVAQDAQPMERRGFWIGFGFAYASLDCDDCNSREGNWSGNVRLGGTINQKLLIGFEAIAYYKKVGFESLTMANASAVAIFYPSETGGFHVKGGPGVHFLEVSDGFFPVQVGLAFSWH